MKLAQITGITTPSTEFTDYSDLLEKVVSRFLLFAISIAGLIFLVRLISAGFSYLTSTGDPAKIQSATKELTNAGIGLFITISAFFIMQILNTIFGLKIFV